MKPEEILEGIQKSLDKPRRLIKYDEVRAKVNELRKSIPSLSNVPKLCDDLNAFIDAREREVAVAQELEKFSSKMESLSTKIDSGIGKISKIQADLQERINKFNLLEAKYTKMISRINGMVDEAERVLKRM